MSASLPRSVPRSSAPSLGGALRSAASDWSANAIVLLVANALWGAVLVLTGVAFLAHPLLGVVGALVLALPTGTLFRIAARLARHEEVGLRDAIDWRTGATRVLAAGALLLGVTLVAGVDVLVALGTDQLWGVALLTLAAWALLGVVLVAAAWWPLVVDPAAPGRSMSEGLATALRIVLMDTRRLLAAVLVSVVIVGISAVLPVALLTLSAGYLALVLCHLVLPRPVPPTTSGR